MTGMVSRSRISRSTRRPAPSIANARTYGISKFRPSSVRPSAAQSSSRRTRVMGYRLDFTMLSSSCKVPQHCAARIARLHRPSEPCAVRAQSSGVMPRSRASIARSPYWGKCRSASAYRRAAASGTKGETSPFPSRTARSDEADGASASGVGA